MNTDIECVPIGYMTFNWINVLASIIIIGFAVWFSVSDSFDITISEIWLPSIIFILILCVPLLYNLVADLLAPVATLQSLNTYHIPKFHIQRKYLKNSTEPIKKFLDIFGYVKEMLTSKTGFIIYTFLSLSLLLGWYIFETTKKD